MKKFKDNLHMMRRDKKLSQIELGKLVNLSHVTISKYELGTMEPTLGALTRIKNVLECSYNELLGE